MVLSEPTVDDPEEPISGARLDPHGRMPLRLRSPLFKHAVLHVQVMLRGRGGETNTQSLWTTRNPNIMFLLFQVLGVRHNRHGLLCVRESYLLP